jgi:two-component system cell cycle response regulator DivK
MVIQVKNKIRTNVARILIIEDNPNNIKLAKVVLEDAGHEVLQAGNASIGLDIARMQLPDIVLMDIQLPDIDGLTATRILKDDVNTSKIKVIALTAFAMNGDEQKMLAAGCDGYISKPIRYKEFLKIINSVL